MIGSRVLAQNENRLGFIKIFKGDRSFSYADRWTQGRPARFVTHVRAVGQVVRAVETDEQLIKKGGFVAGPARSVKDGLIGRIEAFQVFCNQGESLVPSDWFVVFPPFFRYMGWVRRP